MTPATKLWGRGGDTGTGTAPLLSLPHGQASAPWTISNLYLQFLPHGYVVAPWLISSPCTTAFPVTLWPCCCPMGHLQPLSYSLSHNSCPMAHFQRFPYSLPSCSVAKPVPHGPSPTLPLPHSHVVAPWPVSNPCPTASPTIPAPWPCRCLIVHLQPLPYSHAHCPTATSLPHGHTTAPLT